MKIQSTCALVLTALLGGCASGGGSNGEGDLRTLVCVINPLCAIALAASQPPPEPEASTAGWGSMSPGSTRVAPNVRTQMAYRQRDDGSLQPELFGAAPDGPYVEAEVAVRYDAAGRTLLFEPGGLHAPGTTAATYTSLQAVGLPWLDSGSGPTVALVANPHALDWDYQSFGVWNTTTPGGGAMHASSFGTVTPVSAVPASGNATFAGKLAGLYISPAGQSASAAADLSVRADFSARSLSFASTGTIATSDLRTAGAAPDLNLGGSLTYAPASNVLTGTLTSAGGTMSGTTSGRFYGPAAQELGGVFSLRAPTTAESFTGAYGAKR